MAPELAAAIVALRRAHPFWGPKKLRAVLERKHPGEIWPALSTIGDLLRREGMIVSRPRRRAAERVTRPFAAVEVPNDLWCIDFKGWFRTGDGQRCDPFTVTDAESRFLLGCEIVVPNGSEVTRVCEQLFREYGLPKSMRMDNGSPFASSGPAGLTRVSVGWVKLGIALERIEPGSPQQNGRHERMHRTLKQETSRPPAADPAEQQARFDRFRAEFNEHRPHEALGQATPASRYTTSPRPYPAKIEEPWYDADHQVRRVRNDGTIKWHGEYVYLSEALVGETVGLIEVDEDQWLVRFADLDLGLLSSGRKFHRFTAPRPGRCEANPTGELSTM